MKLKLGLAALLLSVSVLLLLSNSFSTAEIRNDVAMSVVGESDALIGIKNWDGRYFSVVNNTETTVVIESMMVMDGEALGVDGWPSYIGAGEEKTFILIGEATELSKDKEIRISASWESGSAEISTMIPYFEEIVNECPDQSKVTGEIVDEEVIEDANLQEKDGEKVNECIEQQEADEESEEVDEEEKADGKSNEDAEGEKEEVVGETEEGEKVAEGVEVKVDEKTEVDKETAAEESVNPGLAEDAPTEETVIIEENNLPEADQTEEADEQ